MKTIIVISTLVDSTIREYQPDVNFVLFHNIEELDNYIATTPLRAESLFFTKEVMPQVNTALNYLCGLLENPFLRVDKVIYITEEKSREIVSIKYVIETREFKNWEIVEGFLTREYVSGIINGTLRTDNVGTKRKVVYRVPKDAYLREKLKNKESLQDRYIDDEQDLANIPDEQPPVYVIPDNVEDGEIVHIVGDVYPERTVFAFLAAQYLSLTGKTLILEYDTDYHLLTEYVTKSKVECYMIDVKEIMQDPALAIENIRKSPAKLVCVICVPRIEYSYSFMFNVLYNNLKENVQYFVREDTFLEAPSLSQYAVAVRNDVPSLLRACENLDRSFISNARFVGVNFQALPETRILSSVQMKTIISDVLDIDEVSAVILNVSTLKVKGSTDYDLRSILGRKS